MWLSIDETTDIVGRYVANVFIRTLNTDGPERVTLLNSEANYYTLSKLFEKSLSLLWPEGRYNMILYFYF